MTNALWYTARGTGTVLVVLFTVTLVLGVVTRGGQPLPGLPRFAVAALHRNVSLLSLVFLVVHVASSVLDHYAKTGWLAAAVPLVGHFRPVWVGLGAVAFDCFVAVGITSLLRGRLGVRTFRAVHWASYAAWPSAVLHGVFTGTDNTRLWMVLLDVAVVLIVAAAVAWRLSDSPRWKRAADRRAAPA